MPLQQPEITQNTRQARVKSNADPCLQIHKQKYKILKTEAWKKTQNSGTGPESFLYLVCSLLADDLQSSPGDSGYCATLLPQVVFREEALI